MPDESDNEKQTNDSTNPVPELEQNLEDKEAGSVSRLRETLINEDHSQEKPPSEKGLLKRLTGALRLDAGPNQKHNQALPAENKTQTVDQPLVSMPEALQENEPGADALPSTPRDLPDEENVQGSSWEGSIFDLLAQLQKGGLTHEELPESEKQAGETILDKPDLPQLPGPDNQLALPPPPNFQEEEIGSKPALGGSKPQGLPTNSSLASRLWGLQELANEQNQSDPSETETAPFAAETAPTESEKGNPKDNYSNHIKGQREEKETKPLHLNDDEIFDRINRTTGVLRPPQDNKKAGRFTRGMRPSGDLQPDSQTEKDNEETHRFTFFPQGDSDYEAKSDATGQAAVRPNPVGPFTNEQPANQVSPAEEIENASPFVVSDEGEVLPQRPIQESLQSSGNPPSSDGKGVSALGGTVTVNGDEFDIEQFLAAAKSEAQPGQKETLSEEEEHAWPSSSLDDLRSIALEQAEIGKAESVSMPGSLPEKGQAASGKGKFPENLRAWWASLSTFNKILLGLVVLLIILIAVSAILIANISGTQKPAVVPPQQPTITPSAIPQPASIILPGGWSFSLTASSFDTPLAVPGTGAWLQGSEVRRVVELPWNKQTEAVAHTFVAGDPVTLVFSDRTSYIYKVQQVMQVSASDTSILTDVKPSLAIILAGENSTSRWIILALP